MQTAVQYFIIYLYLAAVMAAASFVSRKFRNSELSRNLIHICTGLGWIFYRVFFPASIHTVIISASFLLLTVYTEKKQIGFVERKDGSRGTVYYTLSLLLLSILSYGDPLRFDLFGTAIFALAFGDAAANIIGSRFGKIMILPKKSLSGSVGCFLASGAAMLALRAFTGRPGSAAAVLLLALLCTAAELLSGSFDNLAIPFVVFGTALILETRGADARFLQGAGTAAALFAMSLGLKLLTPSASWMLFCMIFIVTYFGGMKSFGALMAVYAVMIITEKLLHRKTDALFAQINKEHGTRTERQLICNCLLPVIAVFFFGLTGKRAFAVAFLAVVAETIGDSMASAVGVLSNRDPVDICTFRRTQRGISGAVSLLGTGTSLAVCVWSGLVFRLFYQGSFRESAAVAAAAAAGILLDSVLGSLVQIRYRCRVCGKLTEKEIHCGTPSEPVKGFRFFDNSRVNLICGLASGLLALLLCRAWGVC